MVSRYAQCFRELPLFRPACIIIFKEVTEKSTYIEVGYLRVRLYFPMESRHDETERFSEIRKARNMGSPLSLTIIAPVFLSFM